MGIRRRTAFTLIELLVVIGVETKAADGAWERGVRPAVKCPGCGNDDADTLLPAIPRGF